MWSIIPPTHLDRAWRNRHLAVEEAVMVPLVMHRHCWAAKGGWAISQRRGGAEEGSETVQLPWAWEDSCTDSPTIIAQCATLFYNAHGPYQSSQLYTMETLIIQKTVVLPWAWEDCWSCTGAPTLVAQQWVQITIHMASTKGATAGYYSGRVKMGLSQKFIRCIPATKLIIVLW